MLVLVHGKSHLIDTSDEGCNLEPEPCPPGVGVLCGSLSH